MAFSLLLLGVCWDPGDVPGRTVTALPTGSAGAAAAALPSDFGTAPATPSGDAGTTTARPKNSAASSALPGTSSASPSARPGPSRAASRTASRTAPPQSPTAGTPEPTRTRPPAPDPLPPSRATRLLIPYLRIDAPIMPLGLDRERRLTAPPEDKPKLVGWYRHGASPGEQGTAVAVGHLDTDRGPAVFAGLTELERGRVLKARRADGRIAVYTIDAIKSYEKSRFPSQEVYGSRGRPELRLITCGGAYDRRKGYSGNVVVFAHLTAVR
ncbi:class F sortase [Streptomyces sp. NPDC057099]|uniref:class F sortase n=1 Tax=Streptomyces sp. NPDC057099 TaxID=3346019 RepID=UPI00363BF432